MQLLCKVSNVFNDVRCPACGQGFLVYGTPTHAADRHLARTELQRALRLQHTDNNGAEAHETAFHFPHGPHPAPEPLRPPTFEDVLVGVYG